jgi:hypothetical protein
MRKIRVDVEALVECFATIVDNICPGVGSC